MQPEFTESFVQGALLHYAKKCMYDAGMELAQRQKTDPDIPQELVDKLGRKHVKSGKMDLLGRLIEFSGTEPDFDEEFIDDTFGAYIEKGQIEEVGRLMQYTRRGPKEYMVASAVSKKIEERKFSEVEMLISVTGYRPKMTMKTIREMNKSLLKEMNLDALEKFKEITGASFSPSNMDVQEAYIDLLLDGEGPERMQLLWDITGVEPKLPPYLVQEKYKMCFKDRDVECFMKWRDFTGIKPDEEAYKGFLDYLQGE